MKVHHLQRITVCIASVLWLAACGSGDSNTENWSVDDVDAGTKTSGSKADGSGSDKAGSGAGGSKSSGSDNKGGAGGSSGTAANSGGKAGSGGKGGSGGGKAGAGKGGSGGSGGTAGTKGAAGKGGASGGTTSVFSAACNACAKADENCSQPERNKCSTFGKDKAKAGPKAGVLKTDLCNELYACILESKCGLGPNDDQGKKVIPIDPSSIQPDECLCGAKDVACEGLMGMTPVTDGPCAMEIQAASEFTLPADVNTTIVDNAYASGAVWQDVQCRAALCAKSCGYCDPADPTCVDLSTGGASTGGNDMDGGV